MKKNNCKNVSLERFLTRVLSVGLSLVILAAAGCSGRSDTEDPAPTSDAAQTTGAEQTVEPGDSNLSNIKLGGGMEDMLGVVYPREAEDERSGAAAVRVGDEVYIYTDAAETYYSEYVYQSESGVIAPVNISGDIPQDGIVSVWETEDDNTLRVPQAGEAEQDECVIYYESNGERCHVPAALYMGARSVYDITDSAEQILPNFAVIVNNGICVGMINSGGTVRRLTAELEGAAPPQQNPDGARKVGAGESDGGIGNDTAIENKLNDIDFMRTLLLAVAAIAVLLLAAVIVLAGRNKRRTADAGIGGAESSRRKSEQSSSHTISVGKLHNIGKRSAQQDSMGMTDIQGGYLAIVADGMGGLENGDKVSQKVIMTMLGMSDGIKKMTADNPLFRMVSVANREVNAMINNHGYSASGSTVIAVFAGEGYFHWVSVGDSRIYLYRNEALIQLNREHNYECDLIVEAVNGLVSFNEVKTNSKRHGLTSYIGMGDLSHVDGSLRPIKLRGGDRIILMSDGVYNTVPEQEIADIIRSSASAEKAAETLESRVQAYRNPKQDNFTAIILEF